MRSSENFGIKMVIIGTAIAIMTNGRSAKADFAFGTPTNLGPPINTEAEEAHTNISADGLTLYFSSSDRSPNHEKKDIWVSRRAKTDDEWGEPENLGPIVNSSANDADPVISADGLTLFFGSDREGGSGLYDIWMTTREIIDSEWSTPVNLGPKVNSSAGESSAHPSADGLSLFFHSYRSGGQGNRDLWVTTRPTTDDEWGIPTNLGPTINGPDLEINPSISTDGLWLFFSSNRPGGYNGIMELYVTMRPTINDPWGTPVNLGPVINEAPVGAPFISFDGRTLHFTSSRDGGFGSGDLWQVPIIPIIDLNGDGIINSVDICKVVDNWHTDYPPCDVAPAPFGDGFVDVRDLTVLAEHLFETVDDPTLVAHWALDESEGTTAQESISSRGDWVIGNPLWQPTGGKVNGALELDGVDDCIITTFGINPAEGPFSVLAWINGGAPGQVTVAQQLVNDWLLLDAEGKLVTELKDADGLAGPLASEKVITDGQWHHIGLVWDGSKRMLSIDEVVVAEDRQTGLLSSDRGLYIGVGKDYAAGTFFSGLIDDVRIYNRAVIP